MIEDSSKLTYPQELVGLSCRLDEVPTGWTTVRMQASVTGVTEEEFKLFVDRLFTWRVHREAGVKVSGSAEGGQVVYLTFGPTVSPCLVLQATKNFTSATLVYGSLPGHIECGEEAFTLTLDGDTVTATVSAFSRHEWWLAKVGAWPARLVQRMITRRYVSALVRLPEKSSKKLLG